MSTIETRSAKEKPDDAKARVLARARVRMAGALVVSLVVVLIVQGGAGCGGSAALGTSPSPATADAKDGAFMCRGAAKLKCLTRKLCTYDARLRCMSCACEPAWDPRHAPDPPAPALDRR